MKSLLVMRHAKSSWKDPDQDDFDRPLSKRGKRDAPKMADWLIRAGLCPDVVLSSPARRARKTAEAIHRACGETVLTWQDTFYPGAIEEYVHVIQNLDNSIGSVMVIGHNPGLAEWLEALSIAVDTFPTAALAHVELDIETWPQLESGTKGILKGYWRPREL